MKKTKITSLTAAALATAVLATTNVSNHTVKADTANDQVATKGQSAKEVAQTNVDNAKKDVQNAQSSLDQAQNNLTAAQSQAEDADSKYKAQSEAVSTAQKDVNAKSTVASDEQSKATSAASLASEAKDPSKVKAANDAISAAQGEVKKAEGEKQAADDKVTAKNKDIEAKSGAVTEAQKSVDSASTAKSNADSAVTKAENALKGTGITKAKEDLDAAIKKVNNDTAALNQAKIDQGSQQAAYNKAKAAQSDATAKFNKATTEKTKANDIYNDLNKKYQAQKNTPQDPVLVELQNKLADLKEKSKNTLVISNVEKYKKAWKDYFTSDKLTSDDIQFLQENSNNNSFKDINTKEDDKAIDLSKISDEDITDLSLFAESILTPLKQQFNLSSDIVTKGSVELTRKILEGYRKNFADGTWELDGWHDSKMINTVSKESGIDHYEGDIAEADQLIEEMGNINTSYSGLLSNHPEPIITLNTLKKAIYNSIKGMILPDGNGRESATGEKTYEFDHAAGLLNVDSNFDIAKSQDKSFEWQFLRRIEEYKLPNYQKAINNLKEYKTNIDKENDSTQNNSSDDYDGNTFLITYNLFPINIREILRGVLNNTAISTETAVYERADSTENGKKIDKFRLFDIFGYFTGTKEEVTERLKQDLANLSKEFYKNGKLDQSKESADKLINILQNTINKTKETINEDATDNTAYIGAVVDDLGTEGPVTRTVANMNGEEDYDASVSGTLKEQIHIVSIDHDLITDADKFNLTEIPSYSKQIDEVTSKINEEEINSKNQGKNLPLIIQAQVDAAKVALDEADTTEKEAKDKSISADTTYTNAKNDLENTSKKVSSLEKEIENDKKTQGKAQAHYNELTKSNKELAEKLETAQAAQQTAQSNLTTAQHKKEDADKELDTAKKELATLQKNVTKVQTNIDNKEKVLKAAQQHVNDLKNADSIKSAADSDLQAAKNALTQANKALDTEKAKLPALEQAKKTADDAVAAAQVDVDTANAQLKAAQDRLAEAQNKLDQLNAVDQAVKPDTSSKTKKNDSSSNQKKPAAKKITLSKSVPVVDKNGNPVTTPKTISKGKQTTSVKPTTITIKGKKYVKVGKNEYVPATAVKHIDAKNKTVELKKTATVVDKNGKTIKAPVVSKSLSAKNTFTLSKNTPVTINGKKYYEISKNQYVPAAAVKGKITTKKNLSLKLTHTAFVYDKHGKVVKNNLRIKFIKRGKTIKPIKSEVVTIKGKKYYQVAKNEFVKVANTKLKTTAINVKAAIRGKKNLEAVDLNGKKNGKTIRSGKTYKFNEKRIIKGKTYYKAAATNNWVLASKLSIKK